MDSSVGEYCLMLCQKVYIRKVLGFEMADEEGQGTSGKMPEGNPVKRESGDSGSVSDAFVKKEEPKGVVTSPPENVSVSASSSGAEPVKKDYVDIPVGKVFSSVKGGDNLWMYFSLILGVVLILIVIANGGGGGGITGNVISEGDAGQNVIDFINAQGQGTASLISVDKGDSFFDVVVDIDGQRVPVSVTFDGSYLVVDPIPLAAGVGTGSGDGGAGGGAGTGERVDVDFGDAPIKGDINAPITIIEFSDYECPFCSRFYSDTLPLLEENYIDTGDVNLVFMDFPLENIHPNARAAGIAAECARELGGDEAYFDMHDLLFENQQDLSDENYKIWAEDIGLDAEEFGACYDSGELGSEVDSDLLYGSSLGITGTPSFFVGTAEKGYLMLEGAQPYGAFEGLIEAELALLQ